MRNHKTVMMFLCAAMIMYVQEGNGALTAKKTRKMIDEANRNGPYLGLVIPNLFEMNPLLQSPDYTASNLTIDVAGRRFRFGTIAGKNVILVMTGLSMINAGVTTQLLLNTFDIEGVVHYGIAGNANPSLNIGDVTIPQYWAHTALWNWQRYGDGAELLLSTFDIEGVVHYGIAGNANPSLNIGDVTIPQYWAHTTLWNWQRYGDGAEDELALEENGDYTREIGYLKFANYTVNVSSGSSYDNLLNNVWYQPEEVFPVDGIPEERQHAFWVPVDPLYFQLSLNLLDLELEGCVNSTTCLTETPKVVTVLRGTSASIYLDNAAYRSFIYETFQVSPVDMESAAVALICLQQRLPFIAFRALSDLAGGGSADSNEAATFTSLAANNSITVVVEFIKQLSSTSYGAHFAS